MESPTLTNAGVGTKLIVPADAHGAKPSKQQARNALFTTIDGFIILFLF
jgi:hypothetical protein